MSKLHIEEDVKTILDRIDLYPLDGKSILVTGGSGLLGTYIVAALQEAARYMDIELFVQVQRGLHAIQQMGPTTLVYTNLANEGDCSRLPNVDVVISAASYAQPLRFMAEPLTALRSSSYGLMALLEKCNVGGRFIYISSSEVYCDCPKEPPYSEDDIGAITPYHPRACYIEAKKFGEAMTYLYRVRGLSTVAVRPGITYGPGTKRGDQRSWASFIERAVTTGEIRLMDAGKVRRTMCYIADGIEMLFRILLYGTQPVYNLAGGSSLSIREMAEIIGKAAGAKVVVPKDDHGVAGTPDDLRLSTERYEAEFGKRAFVDVETGLRRAVEWWREFYGY